MGAKSDLLFVQALLGKTTFQWTPEGVQKRRPETFGLSCLESQTLALVAFVALAFVLLLLVVVGVVFVCCSCSCSSCCCCGCGSGCGCPWFQHVSA